MNDTTDWFLGHLSPARQGPYQRVNNLGEKWFSYWDGVQWFLNSASPDAALRNFKLGIKSRYQRTPWRGLAEKPA